MATMNVNDHGGQRKGSYGTSATYPLATYGHPPSQAQTLRAAQYLSTGNHMMHQAHGDGGMGPLAHGFGAMNMQSHSYASGRRSNSHVPATTEYGGGVPLNQGYNMPHAGGQQFVYSNGQVVPNPAQPQAANAMYPPVSHYMQPGNYPAQYMQQHGVENNAAHHQHWNSRHTSDGSHMPPSLITPRRGSISSNEDHVPSTPYNGYGGYHNGVAIMDRSPGGVFTNNTTPSPSQYMQNYGIMAPKPYTAPPISQALLQLIQQEPAIPRAIPAPSSPVKPLDRCLENKNGETNVYIRGLLPETTDEMLHGWGGRFGDIQSSKSIIDHKTNQCKGFGFIKYHNFEDAEDCIRGFHFLGYEVSFARESFYSKLKKFADEQNTNLYVSNIPRNFNEHELSNCFLPCKVCSARILRDDRGNGRGVGFARFESRDVCEEVIRKFNNTSVCKPGGEEHIIQIRYSDTHEQKMLKQQTAAARQFRAAEFEYGCLQASRAGLLTPDRLGSVSPTTADAANEFEHFLQAAHASANTGMPPRNPSIRSNIMTRPALPTILSDQNVASPSTPSTLGIMVEEGVPLPMDNSEAKSPIIAPKGSPAKTAIHDKDE